MSDCMPKVYEKNLDFTAFRQSQQTYDTLYR